MKVLSILILSFSLFAAPKKIIVNFFDSKDLTSLLNTSAQSLVAKNVYELKCQKMGEYCFDPQVGLYKAGKENEAVQVKNESVVDPSLKKVRGLGDQGFFNTQLINCDKNNFYDVFCNKGKKSKNIKEYTRSKNEIWIDGSGAVKVFDTSKLEKTCKREDFIKLLKSSCTKNNFYQFYSISNVKKQLGTSSQACQSSDEKIKIDKLIAWMNSSNANTIHIYLDEFYAQGKFMAYLKTKPNIKVNGIDTKIKLSQMSEQVNELKRYCN